MHSLFCWLFHVATKLHNITANLVELNGRGSSFRCSSFQIPIIKSLICMPDYMKVMPQKTDCFLLAYELRHEKKKTTDFCICENKGADQLCSNYTADQRL